MASLWAVSDGDETETAPPAPRPRKKKKKKKRAEGTPDVSPRTAAPPPAATSPSGGGVVTPQRLVLLAAALAAAGLALASHQPSDTGRVFWVAGTLLFVVGIHMLGRLGPDGLEAAARLRPPANESIERRP